MGGTYERLFERYLARVAMEQYSEELKTLVELMRNQTELPPGQIWYGLCNPSTKTSFVELFPRALVGRQYRGNGR